MLRFGVVTDVHFGPEARFEGKLRKLSHQAPVLAKAFAERMRNEVEPDLVVNLGDCIQDESVDADRKRYRACLDTLRRSGVELVNVAGNHDRVNLDAGELRSAWGLALAGPLYRSFDRAGIHVVVLATHEVANVAVTIDDEQLVWLEADLAATELDTVVLMHHAAAEQDLTGNRWFEGAPHICLVRERARLREVLERHGRTRLVLNGHLHWNHLDVIHGVPYVTLQSLIENLDDDAPGRAAATHAVVSIDGDRVLIEVAGEQACRYQFER
jgi:3',5'-cyclic-AMP phosphodiesterase